MKILFLHGWTSTPGGMKPTFLKDHGHEILNPALPDNDFDEAIRIAQAEFDQHKPDVVVGSSQGGAVAMNIDSKDTQGVRFTPSDESRVKMESGIRQEAGTGRSFKAATRRTPSKMISQLHREFAGFCST